jgi:hypothetical protein
MKLLPKYPEHIIVAVKYSNSFSWYVTNHDPWFLDLNILKAAYKEKFGIDIDINASSDIRCGISLLDESTFGIFKGRISEFRYSTGDLRELLYMMIEDSPKLWRYEMQPSLFVDFDAKVLYNNYYETVSFENYVPPNWHGSCADIRILIPFEARYWITDDGYDYFADTMK